MNETSKKHVLACRARAGELRAKAETLSDVKEREMLLHDALMWERMAEWEEKNSPRSN